VSVELDELVEHWTLLDGDHELVAGKRSATRLGFALLLKFYTRHGRFPGGPDELPGEAVAFVARQVDVAAGELSEYECCPTSPPSRRSERSTRRSGTRGASPTS
jgi:uncharacterized protein DUF4158